MRRATVIFFYCGCIALFSISSVFAGGMGVLGVGAKASAMGGSFRAIADDWSAAYYNPAGLFYMTENELTINEVISNYQLKFTPHVNYGGYPVGFYQGEIYNRYEILTNPTLGGYFKLPVSGRDIVAGLAIFQPFDQNLSWGVFSPLNNGASLPGQQIEHNFDAVALNAVIAVELMENKLSFGLSGGLLKGDLIYGGFFLRKNPADPDASYYERVASRPNDLITEWQHSDGYGLGFNLRSGLLYKATEKLSMGLSYALPSSITIDGDSYFYYYMPDNPYYQLDDDVLFPNSENYILSHGDVYEAEGTFETEVKLPGQLAGGIAYQVNDKLLIAGDMEMTFWSNFEGYAFDYQFKDSAISYNDEINTWMVEDLTLPVDWKNTISGSIGLQYAYTEKVFLRAGYAADQSPVEPGSLHIAFFDSGLKHSGTLGLGLVFENVRLDFSTKYTKYPESIETGNVKLLNGDGTEDSIVDNLPGTYSGSAFESIAQFTVRF